MRRASSRYAGETGTSKGTTVANTNRGKGSFAGSPSSDVNYMVLAFEPVYIFLTTYSPQTAISTKVTLMSNCPGHNGATALANQPADFYCSVLEYEINDPYWVAVEGMAAHEEGANELTSSCFSVPTDKPTPAPSCPPSQWCPGWGQRGAAAAPEGRNWPPTVPT